jgi:hypothetical protein
MYDEAGANSNLRPDVAIPINTNAPSANNKADLKVIGIPRIGPNPPADLGLIDVCRLELGPCIIFIYKVSFYIVYIFKV